MTSDPDKQVEALEGEKLKSQIASNLNKLLENLNKPQPESRKIDLNSAFVVTVIGGLVLAAVGALLQYAIANSQRREAIRSERVQRNQKLAYTFADKYPTTLYLARRFMIRQIWLGQHSPNTQDPFTDGRNFVDTRTLYEQLLDRYVSQRSTASLCNEVVVAFPSPRIRNLALSLNNHVETLLNATNEAQVNTEFQQANQDYRDLTGDIFLELNNAE